MKYGKIVPLSEIEDLLVKERDRDERIADMKADIREIKVGQVMKFTITNKLGFGAAGFLKLLVVDLPGKFNTYQDGVFIYLHRTE